MAYIGIQPAEKFTSFATQEFSTSATTSYTLDHAVTNENEIALFVNNVRQQPGSGKAYTASGTALTLSAATASTDTMYCIFLGRALQTVTPATNSVTSAMTNFFNASTSSADLGTGLHVKSGDSSVSSLSVSHDELVVESDGNVGISIIGGTSSTMGVAFGDSGDNDIGRINYVHSDNSMRFINNATENVHIHSNGVMAANAGIALGVGTANTSSNVLDDYEEGTWTPTFTHGGSSVSFTLTRANYTKVGRLVYVTMTGRYTGSSLTGGDLIGGGLPFTSSSDNVLGVTGGYIHDPGSGNSNYDAGIAGSHNGNDNFYLIVTPGGRYQQRWLQNYYLQTGFWYFV
jgi:hypothetical protein